MIAWINALLFALKLAYWIFVCKGGCGCEVKTKKGEYPPGWYYKPNRGWLCPDCAPRDEVLA